MVIITTVRILILVPKEVVVRVVVSVVVLCKVVTAKVVDLASIFRQG